MKKNYEDSKKTQNTGRLGGICLFKTKEWTDILE